MSAEQAYQAGDRDAERRRRVRSIDVRSGPRHDRVIRPRGRPHRRPGRGQGRDLEQARQPDEGTSAEDVPGLGRQGLARRRLALRGAAGAMFLLALRPDPNGESRWKGRSGGASPGSRGASWALDARDRPRRRPRRRPQLGGRPRPEFGLKHFANVNNEPHHVQLAEFPNGRSEFEASGAAPATPGGGTTPGASTASGPLPAPELLGGGGERYCHQRHRLLDRRCGRSDHGGRRTAQLAGGRSCRWRQPRSLGRHPRRRGRRILQAFATEVLGRHRCAGHREQPRQARRHPKQGAAALITSTRSAPTPGPRAAPASTARCAEVPGLGHRRRRDGAVCSTSGRPDGLESAGRGPVRRLDPAVNNFYASWGGGKTRQSGQRSRLPPGP